MITALRIFTVCLFIIMLVDPSPYINREDSGSKAEAASINQESARSAVSFLARMMDQCHNRFPVYDDVSSPCNHFVAFGKIPDEDAPVEVNGSWADNPHSGATAIRFAFTGPSFGGYYFLNGLLPPEATSPQVNFGETPNSGINLSGANTLTFWARGEKGGEEIDFFVAGVGWHPERGHPVVPFPGSSTRIPAKGHTFRLTATWQQFTIDLRGHNLSYVLGGFGWAASTDLNPSGAVFFLDDIQFDLDSDARDARLNEPRFLTSFVTLPTQPDPFDDNTDDDIDFVLRNLAFSYDNALVLLAFLAEGSDDSIRRARLLGDAYVYASQNDRTYDDGRIRTAYAAGDISLPPGWIPNGRAGTVPIPGFFSEVRQMFFEVEQEAVDVGNNSWTMIALLGLFKVTQEPRYIESARKIGEFILSFRNDTGTFQGFQGGLSEPESDDPTARPFASGEHNIDVYAAFRVMFDMTGESVWNAGSEHARTFVEAMYAPSRGCLLAGSSDPETRNTQPGQLPVDVQAWSILARIPLALQEARTLLRCAESNHLNAHNDFSGFDFNENKDGVWFEGTGHMAVAYMLGGQNNVAADLTATLRRAQSTAPFGDAFGISATSRDGLTTGFGFKFFRRLHIAATSWLVFAQLRFNPYYQETLTTAMGVLFSEHFEQLSSLQDNGGLAGRNGWPTFAPGVVGNGADFTGSRSVCYPISENFHPDAGTVEFWVKPPQENHVGFFDLGVLGRPNSWGIFKNRDHVIMEVKSQNNRFDQAWTPTPVSFDNGWHFVAAVWERVGETTRFKVCWDGVCKPTFDGLTSNSIPDLNGQFCVGWAGFYGHSESAFDQLHIFDHVKSDGEITADFKAVVPPQ